MFERKVFCLVFSVFENETFSAPFHSCRQHTRLRRRRKKKNDKHFAFSERQLIGSFFTAFKRTKKSFISSTKQRNEMKSSKIEMSVSENRISCSKTIHFSVFLVRAQHRRRRRRPSSFICWHNVCVRLLFVSLRWHVRQSLSMRLMNIQHFSRWWKQTPTATPPSMNERRSFIEFTEAVCVVSIISHIYIKMKMFKRIGVVIVHRATSDVCRKFIRNCENDAMTTNRIKMRFHHFFVRSFSRKIAAFSTGATKKKTQFVLAVLTNNRTRKKKR